MKQKVLLLAALLLAAAVPQAAWGQEFGKHLNLKGKEAVCVSSSLPSFVIKLDASAAPPGFDRGAVGRELVSRLTELLRIARVPVREVISTAGADAGLGFRFSILPIRRGGTVEGYAINGHILLADWTSHSYPVTIWENLWLRVTRSRTASELRSDLLEMTTDMAAELIIDWTKANR